MKIDAKLTLLVSGDVVRLEIHDDAASICFLEAEIDPVAFMSALGRLSGVPFTAEVRGLDCVGKKLEMDTLEFEMPGDSDYSDQRKAIAKKLATEKCPEGWKASDYFGSQNSFRSVGGKTIAKTTIRRWVAKEPTP